MGIMPDLILIDYLDLVKPHQRYNTRTDEQIAVVQAVVGFAQEFDLSIWTACQLNRGGLVMETPDESAQAGSIERQFVADMVFWLAQTKDERQDEIMRIVSSKNRNGKTGWTIKLDTAYDFMTFYRSPEVQGTEEDDAETNEGTVETTIREVPKRDLADEVVKAISSQPGSNQQNVEEVGDSEELSQHLYATEGEDLEVHSEG